MLHYPDSSGKTRGLGFRDKESEATEAARNPARGDKSPRCLRAKPCRAGLGILPVSKRRWLGGGAPKGFAGKQRGASSSARACGLLLISESQMRGSSGDGSFVRIDRERVRCTEVKRHAASRQGPCGSPVPPARSALLARSAGVCIVTLLAGRVQNGCRA